MQIWILSTVSSKEPSAKLCKEFDLAFSSVLVIFACSVTIYGICEGRMAVSSSWLPSYSLASPNLASSWYLGLLFSRSNRLQYHGLGKRPNSQSTSFVCSIQVMKAHLKAYYPSQKLAIMLQISTTEFSWYKAKHWSISSEGIDFSAKMNSTHSKPNNTCKAMCWLIGSNISQKIYFHHQVDQRLLIWLSKINLACFHTERTSRMYSPLGDFSSSDSVTG